MCRLGVGDVGLGGESLVVEFDDGVGSKRGWVKALDVEAADALETGECCIGLAARANLGAQT
jgi:hypothetical protein